MDRATRHKIKHDKFVDDVGTAYSYMREHSRPVVWGIAAALAAIVLISGMFLYRRGQESRAQRRLAEAITILETPIEPQPPAGGPAPKYKTEQEKAAKAQPIFQDVANKYGGTNAADIAELYLAHFAADRGDLASARPKLQEFLRRHPDHILASAAQRSLYELRLSAGEGAQVVAELERNLSSEKGILPDDVTLALLAQALERTGNAVKAKETYQRIVNEFPDSPYSLDAQRKLAQG